MADYTHPPLGERAISILVPAVVYFGGQAALNRVPQTVAQLRMPTADYAGWLVEAMRRGDCDLTKLVTQPLEVALAHCMRALLRDEPRRAPISIAPTMCRDSAWSLQDLGRAGGYKTNYVVCSFATVTADGWSAPDAVEAEGVVLRPLNFGNRQEYFRHKSKRLKTQTNWQFELREAWIPGSVFDYARERFTSAERDSLSFMFPHFVGTRGNQLGELPRFVCAVTGRVFFCECARTFIEERRGKRAATIDQYARSAPARAELAELSSAAFVRDLCHLCVAAAHGLEAMLDRYGSDVLENHRVYVEQEAQSKSLTIATAITEVQRKLGVTRWKRETELYVVVRQLFPDRPIEREARLPWLGVTVQGWG